MPSVDLRTHDPDATYSDGDNVLYDGVVFTAATAAEKGSAVDYSQPVSDVSGDWRLNDTTPLWTLQRATEGWFPAYTTKIRLLSGEEKTLSTNVLGVVQPDVADAAARDALTDGMTAAQQQELHGARVTHGGVQSIYNSIDDTWSDAATTQVPGNPNIDPVNDSNSWIAESAGGIIDPAVAAEGDTLTTAPVGSIKRWLIDTTGMTPTVTKNDSLGVERNYVAFNMDLPITDQVTQVGVKGPHPVELTSMFTDGAGNSNVTTNDIINGSSSTFTYSDYVGLADGEWSFGLHGGTFVSAPELLIPITKTGNYSINPVDYGNKRIAIDGIPVFPAITADHIGKTWILRNTSGSDMTIPAAANLDMELDTFGPKQLIFVHCVAANMYEISGASS